MIGLRSDDAKIVSDAVLSAALYSGDGAWAEQLAYRLIDHSEPVVRGNALLSLAHIARVHGTLDRQRAIDVLRAAKNDRDEFVRGQANDALEDVQHYIKRNGRWIGGD
ncbi:MAG: HEAT repeat domain-containing protein [Pyrinomonadaceae bacterium]